MYSDQNFKSKKELKAAVAAGPVHSTLWVAAIAAALAGCTPRACISPDAALPADAAAAVTGGTALAPEPSGAPMIDGLPECEAR